VSLCPVSAGASTRLMPAISGAALHTGSSLTTAIGRAQCIRPEALGSRQLPLDDAALSKKFMSLVAPACGEAVACSVLDALWELPETADVGAILNRLRPRHLAS
jgi:hypothetical protein